MIVNQVESLYWNVHVMSLFGNSGYHYHETIFLFFENANRPTADSVEAAIKKLRYKSADLQVVDDLFDSMTIFSDQDFAAMAVAYVEQSEVLTSIEEIYGELKTAGLSDEEEKQISVLSECNARFDVFHFEKIITGEAGEMINPGALLLVLNTLCELTSGIAIDPQSLTVY